MARINTRACIVIISVILLIGCAKEKTADEYLQSANLYLESDDFRAALIETRNAVSLAPRHKNSRALLGQLELKTGNPVNAESELLKALELGVPKAELASELAEAYWLQGKWEDLSQIDVTGLTDENKARVLGFQAEGAMALGDISSARLLLGDALSADSTSDIALLANARMRLIENDMKAARSLLANVLDNDPEYSAAWELLGDIEAGELRYPEALSAYSSAINTGALTFSPLLKRVRIHHSVKDTKSALTDIETLEQANASAPLVNLLKSDLLLTQGKYAEAQLALEEALKNAPDFQPAVRALAITHLLRKNLGQSEQYAKQYFDTSESDDSFVLLAMIRLQSAKFEQAERTLLPLARSGRLGVQGSQVLATSQIKLGKFDDSVQTMLDLHRNIKEKTNLETTSLAMETDPATAVSEELMGAQNTQSNGISVANYLSESDLQLIDAVEALALEDYPKALGHVDSLIEKQPENVDLYTLLARIHMNSGNTDMTEEALELAIKLDPNHQTALILSADLKTKSGDASQAIDILKGALAISTGLDREQIYLRLASLEALIGSEENAIEWLLQSHREDPSSYQPALALAKHYTSKSDPAKVLEVLSELSSPENKNPQVAELLVRAHTAIKDFDRAIELLNPLVTSEPDRALWRFLRAMANAGRNDVNAVGRDLDAALRINPDHTPSKIAKANYSILTGDLEQAEIQLTQLESLIPSTEALNQLSDRVETAREKSKQSGERPNSYDTTDSVLKKARTLWSNGNLDEAVDTLQDWLAANPNDITVRLTLANTLVALDRQSEALRTFRSVVELDENNFVALNNLAWQLRSEDPSTAMAYAARAVNIKPDNLSALDTLAVIQFEQGLITKAGETFKAIQALEPKDPTILFHGARIQLALGNKAEAKLIIEPLVKNQIDFPEAEAALDLLNNL